MAALKVIAQSSPDPDTDPDAYLHPDLHPDDIAIHLPSGAQLEPGAGEVILAAMAEHPEAAAVYWDILVGDQRQARPAWSPTRVQSEPGVCLPFGIRASWPHFNSSSHPLEMECRLAESDAVVLHIPSVLTRHADPAGAAQGQGAASSSGELRLSMRSSPAQGEGADHPGFEPGPRPGTHRRRPLSRGQASTSIIIPSAGRSLPGSTVPVLVRCLETLALLDPPPLEVVVVIGDEYQGEPPTKADGLPVRVVYRGTGSFDFSRAINCGLLASRGEFVLLLNDDIEAETEAETTDWLGRMVAHLQDPTVGVVGAALLYPDRTVQHIGMVIDDAHPLHPFQHHKLADTAAYGGDVARDTISVTGACLLARRSDLLAVGGMSQEFPTSYGDIDLCLRLRRSGFRVVVEPAAVLIHHESASREPIIEPWEWGRFLYRWGEVLDPWYHPAYRRPDDPDHKNRNADHLGPVDPDASWTARSTEIRSTMHESQMHEYRLGIPPRIHP